MTPIEIGQAPSWRIHWFERPLQAIARNPALALSILVVAIVIGWALLPALFTGYNPIVALPADKLRPPSAAHWFGTDYLGRDLYARLVHGAGRSLQAAVLAVVTGLLIGTALGLLGGFAGGIIDDAIMRCVDVMLAVPGLLLSLVFITTFGFGTVQIGIAVGVGSFASFARVMRAEVLRSKTSTYVEASRVIGASPVRVMFRHVLPNSIQSVLALAALELAYAILAVAALSFLGFGAAPPDPEWGALVAEGRDYVATSWWLIMFPGLVIAAVVVSVNRIAHVFKL
jgi:peptide/nickel transport system permease protein